MKIQRAKSSSSSTTSAEDQAFPRHHQACDVTVSAVCRCRSSARISRFRHPVRHWAHHKLDDPEVVGMPRLLRPLIATHVEPFEQLEAAEALTKSSVLLKELLERLVSRSSVMTFATARRDHRGISVLEANPDRPRVSRC